MLKNNIAKLLIISIIFFIICVCALSGCGDKMKIRFTYSRNGYIWFQNSVIQLRFDDKMYCKVFYRDTTHSINNASTVAPFSKPSHFIVLDGTEISKFTVDYDNIKCIDIKTEFGNGKRLVLKGTTTGPKNCEIEKTLTVEMYNDYPDAAITYANYKNLGSANLTIDTVYNNYYLLDASLAEKTKQPNDFWSFQGSAIDWGKDYIFPISDGFAQDNWMGLQP
ncbi:MAG: hypothetical protein JSW07_09310, partial [bacterium]